MISNDDSPNDGATPLMMETPSDHTTLTEVIDGYREAGFDGDFWAEEGGKLRCNHCGSVAGAQQFTMHSLRRLEGASDPDDMVAVVASTCPTCQSNGTLVLGYGPMSSKTDADVLLAMQDHRDSDVLSPDSGPTDEPVSS
jgi:hypothetical protein